jgi:hypothetical protein
MYREENHVPLSKNILNIGKFIYGFITSECVKIYEDPLIFSSIILLYLRKRIATRKEVNKVKKPCELVKINFVEFKCHTGIQTVRERHTYAHRSLLLSAKSLRRLKVRKSIVGLIRCESIIFFERR